MNKLMHIVIVAALAGAGSVLALGTTGCGGGRNAPAETNFLAVPPELEPRPDLQSVPGEAVRVAVMSGTGGFNYTVERHQRWYLVDEVADRLLASNVAERRGTLTVGKGGATLGNNQVWTGDTENVDSLALYVGRRIERP